MEKEGAYVHFATYPICHWSGTLGPKIREGDKQTPEGFYTVTARQLHRLGRWRQALNLGFPNAYDEGLKRDGSYILIHGGCSSVGCFAMTNPVIEEIYTLTSAALRAGQRHVPVHVFPFRMTDANLENHKGAAWFDFWLNLKEGYDAFERTKRPPYVSVCNGRYRIEEMTASPLEAGVPGPLAVCGPTAAALLNSDKSAWLVPLGPRPQLLTPRLPQLTVTVTPPPRLLPVFPQREQQQSMGLIPSRLVPSSIVHPLQLPPPLGNLELPPSQNPLLQYPPNLAPLQPSSLTLGNPAAIDPAQQRRTTVGKPRLVADTLLQGETRKAVATIDPALAYELVPRLVAPPSRQSGIRERALPCNLSLASCRKYAALQSRRPKANSKVASQAQLRKVTRLR